MARIRLRSMVRSLTGWTGCRSSARNYAQVQAEMPEVRALAGGGQGFETFAAARQAGDRGGQA